MRGSVSSIVYAKSGRFNKIHTQLDTSTTVPDPPHTTPSSTKQYCIRKGIGITAATMAHHQSPILLCMDTCKDGSDDDGDAHSTDWLNDVDVTNGSVVLTFAASNGCGDDILAEKEDPWHHLLMMDCSGGDNNEDVEDFAAAKRVSLDVTETGRTTATSAASPGSGRNATTECYEADALASFLDYSGLESDPVLIQQAAMTATATHHCVNEQHSNLLLLHSNTAEDDPWRELQIDDEDLLLMNEDIQVHNNNYYYYCNEHFKGDATTTTITSSSSRDASEEDEEEDESFATTSGTPTTTITSLWVGGGRQLWHERRKQLAASMQASERSRQACYKTLNEHVQLRANLKRVLADIAQSTTAVQEQICGGGRPQPQKLPKARPLLLSPQLSTSRHSNNSTTAEKGNGVNDRNEQQQHEAHLLLPKKDNGQDADN